MQQLKLLVAVDDSDASRWALEMIAPLTRSEAVVVVLVSREADPGRADKVLDAAVVRLGHAAQVQRRHYPGPLQKVLTREACEVKADLVVVSPPPHATWRRWLHEWEALSLARQLPTSLLLVQPEHVIRPLRRALLAGGGAPTLRDAAQLAGCLLSQVDGTATVCHVLLRVPLGYGPRTTDQSRMEVFLASESPEAGQFAAALEILRDAGVPAEVKLRVGLVVDEILAEVEHGAYDLLIIGAHRVASRIDRLLLTDISAELLQKSPVPVLLVRPSAWS
ncbi:MAG TPA: universal stress protein [Herpetosiphonaceae bacterium]|nr:universal stress protein [Herpetosiphonaceae bacterium]